MYGNQYQSDSNTLVLQEITARIHKWDYLTLRSFCTITEPVERRRDNLQNRKNVSHSLDRGLIVCKQCKYIRPPEIKIKKVKQWVNEIKRHFIKREVQMVDKCVKKCLMSLFINEM